MYYIVLPILFSKVRDALRISMGTDEDKPNFAFVDSLRGLAALYVVINHCRGSLFPGIIEYSKQHANIGVFTHVLLAVNSLTRCGAEFVIFFFVLSGFSIAYSLDRNNNVLGFYFRRVVRLYPPYLAGLLYAIIVYCVVLYFIPEINDCTNKHSLYSKFCGSDFLAIKSILLNLVYIPNGTIIPQFWSLTHEVLFYLLFPLFILQLRIYCILSIGLFCVGLVAHGLHVSSSIFERFLLDYNIYFVIGILIYKNWSKIMHSFTMKKHHFGLISGALFLMMIIVNAKLFPVNKISSLLSALLAVVMLTNFHAHQLYTPILQFLGKISYTLYLTHYATMFLLAALVLKFTPIALPSDNILLWVFAVPLCCLMAFFHYLAVERKTKEYLEKLRK